MSPGLTAIFATGLAKRPLRPPNLESRLGLGAAFYGRGPPPIANGRLQLEKSTLHDPHTIRVLTPTTSRLPLSSFPFFSLFLASFLVPRNDERFVKPSISRNFVTEFTTHVQRSNGISAAPSRSFFLRLRNKRGILLVQTRWPSTSGEICRYFFELSFGKLF